MFDGIDGSKNDQHSDQNSDPKSDTKVYDGLFHVQKKDVDDCDDGLSARFYKATSGGVQVDPVSRHQFDDTRGRRLIHHIRHLITKGHRPNKQGQSSHLY